MARRADERCIPSSDPQRVWQRRPSKRSRVRGTAAFPGLIFVALVASQSASAQEQPAPTGSGVDALPGVYEVPLSVRSSERLNTRLGFGYGWTEAVLKMDDTHHRLQLDAAGSVTPLPWLAVALRLLGRYDVHTGGVSDSGAVTETHVTSR